MTDYIKITFQNLSPENEEILIAYLAGAGYEGFEQNDTGLITYIPLQQYDKSLLQELALKYPFSFTDTITPSQNWNHAWESSFEPVVLEGFLAIRADFHPPQKGVKHEIIITPKMSFGTGHHATTRLMALQMQEINFFGKRVLDFGTGTGLLAILAEKSGAAHITAIDNDDWSIANAVENIKQNCCTNVHIDKLDTIPDCGPFDIILSNINRNIILENFSQFKKYIRAEGILLLSGILPEDEEIIRQKASAFNFQLIKKTELNNWICLRFSC